MRIGVYGGTFNPIHLGHTHILGEFMARLRLDQALLIPTGIPPHKQAHALASPQDRAAMCALAAEEVSRERVRVSSIELERPGKSYTALTLRALREEYPGDEIFLLMGEDMFLTVDSWYEAGEIFRLAALCASPRSPEGQKRLLEKKRALEDLGARCFVEDIPFWDVSSTRVRELAARGESLEGLVPPRVAEYIREHQIYRSRRRRN